MTSRILTIRVDDRHGELLGRDGDAGTDRVTELLQELIDTGEGTDDGAPNILVTVLEIRETGR